MAEGVFKDPAEVRIENIEWDLQDPEWKEVISERRATDRLFEEEFYVSVSVLTNQERTMLAERVDVLLSEADLTEQVGGVDGARKALKGILGNREQAAAKERLANLA
jgi:hypothetical protein